jgi:hypothetical protein
MRPGAAKPSWWAGRKMKIAHPLLTPDHPGGVPNQQAADTKMLQPGSGESPRATEARSATPGDSPPDSQVIRQCGRFALTKSPEGLRWVLTSRAGSIWHWHAEGRQWLVGCHAYRTEAEATAGLEETLAHEQAGDLDEQHAAPPARHGPG